MRRLFPDPELDVDPADAYGRLPPVAANRPAVRLNMIESVDGAAAVNGRTVGLGGTADHTVAAILRSLADVILVGAGTVRTEAYGPAVPDDTGTARRAALGLVGAAVIAVLTRSCRLDWQSPFFTQAEQRPIVLTTANANPTDRDRAQAVADVVIAGEAAVDLAVALRVLAGRGVRNVLAEGGPRVSAQLAAGDLLDELCLTLAPKLVAGPAFRILNGPVLDPPAALDLDHVLESDGYLFLRYRRRR